MTLRFRLARGLAVVLAIVLTHFIIFWLFNTMKIPMPALGPVFATLMVEPEPAAESSAPAEAIDRPYRGDRNNQ